MAALLVLNAACFSFCAIKECSPQPAVPVAGGPCHGNAPETPEALPCAQDNLALAPDARVQLESPELLAVIDAPGKSFAAEPDLGWLRGLFAMGPPPPPPALHSSVLRI